MRWPWTRERYSNGARAAQEAASEALDDAMRQQYRVAEVARVARLLARQAHALTDEVEQALRGL